MNKIPSIISTLTNDLHRNTQALMGDKLRKVILYGSYARGDYKEYSDLDIMVLADYSESEGQVFQDAIYKLASRASLEHDITVSMYLNNDSLFNSRLHISPFYRNVLSEGIEIHGAR